MGLSFSSYETEARNPLNCRFISSQRKKKTSDPSGHCSLRGLPLRVLNLSEDLSMIGTSRLKHERQRRNMKMNVGRNIF